jgi:phosphate transport system permease protein
MNAVPRGLPRALAARRRKERFFVVFCVCAATVSLVILAVLLVSIFVQGVQHLDAEFLKSSPSRKPERAGIHPALVGSIWICAVCALVAIPLGVGTAIFLEEYRPRRRLFRMLHGFVQLNIANLAGVPSVVYGILGLTAFVQMIGLFGNMNEPLWTLGTPEDWYYVRLPFGRGVLAGGLTLMLVVLPIVIIASQESLRAVPDSLREGALALGATRWQMVRRMTLPAAIPGIMTGTILAMSRAIGEAAPVLIIAGLVYITFTPVHLMDDFTAMPLQIYDWAGRPQEEFHRVAAAGIMILLGALLLFNALAIFIRQKFQKPLQ